MGGCQRTKNSKEDCWVIRTVARLEVTAGDFTSVKDLRAKRDTRVYHSFSFTSEVLSGFFLFDLLLATNACTLHINNPRPPFRNKHQ